ncbi:MAG: MerR family transcriptional regulator, partial [Desulfovibrio sp.]|nr:MerR family transcriptional regulator [Desulfovibrio sp.]
MDTNKRFTLEELSILSGVSPRTIRYYMQKGLMDKPEGATRGSYYLAGHLEQLLLVKRWQAAGLSLERIQEIAGGAPAAVPEPRPKPGDVRVESRIYLAPGVHLCIDAARAGLAPEAVR